MNRIWPVALAMAPAMLAAQVTLTLDEYRKLVDAAAARPVSVAAPKPPAFRRAVYDVDIGNDQAALTARFEAGARDEPPGSISLPGAGLVIESITPADTVLRQSSGDLVWGLSSPGRNDLEVRFLAKIEALRSGRRLAFQTAPALTAQMRVKNVPSGWAIDVPSGIWTADGTWSLPPGGEVEVFLRPGTGDTRPEPRIPMPPVIREATNKTRIVRDGAFLTTLEWVVMHDEPIALRLRPGEGTQWVSCKVAGASVAPTASGTGAFEIPIRAESGPTKVELTYTGSTVPFEAVRGKLRIALPGCDLLVESLQWELTLPEGFEPVAVEGNCEFLPSTRRHVLHLRRELARGGAAEVGIFYQKPETKNP